MKVRYEYENEHDDQIAYKNDVSTNSSNRSSVIITLYLDV